MLVDGVSSFGAEAIDFSDERCRAVAATANKCLHGVPGASFVIARRTALAQAASRTYYLDLGRLARLQDQRNTPFTPAVHAYYAWSRLCASLPRRADASRVIRRYAALAEQVRAGLAELWHRSGDSAGTVVGGVAFLSLPAGLTYPQLHDALKAEAS